MEGVSKLKDANASTPDLRGEGKLQNCNLWYSEDCRFLIWERQQVQATRGTGWWTPHRDEEDEKTEQRKQHQWRLNRILPSQSLKTTVFKV